MIRMVISSFYNTLINYEEAIKIANEVIGEEIINKLHFCEEF